MPSRSFRWFTPPVLLWVALALLPSAASAQVPPILTINDAIDFEGNAGSKSLVFTVTLTGPSSVPVTAQLSAIPLTGSGFNAATGGASCGGQVDFVQLNNVPFTIPANTTMATVNITICGDTVIEPNEHIFVSLTNVLGAQCFEGTCNAVGTIRNDDGLPSLTINNISTSAPSLGTHNTAFTVSLSHSSPLPTSVAFATRNGTAQAVGACPPLFFSNGKDDYVSRSDTLSIPPNTLTGSIAVTICSNVSAESDETFFVVLSNPANATIADGSGQGTIRQTFLTTGGFDLSPDDIRVQVDEKVTYTVVWTVPEGRVWHDLHTIDLRIRNHEKTALRVSWDEPSNTFSLCQQLDHDDNEADNESGHGVVCGPGALPGTATVLETRFARLHLAETSVVGSGPTGRNVSLNLSISFRDTAAEHYQLELAATDDFGHQDNFVQAGTLRVQHAHKHR